MPRATNRGVELYYEAAGEGETVAFVADLGLGAWQWSWQAPALAGGFETVVMDNRGAGRSDAPDGPYTVGAMAADLEAVLADHGARSAHLVGAGMGGMVALQYALEYGRADRLVLMGTAASGGPFRAGAMLGGPEDLAGLVSEGFAADRPDAVERIVGWSRDEDAGADAAESQAAAVREFDAGESLHGVEQPALVMHGEADAVVPVRAGRELADGLPRGRFEAFRDGSHLFFVEQARLVTDALAGFLEGE